MLESKEFSIFLLKFSKTLSFMTKEKHKSHRKTNRYSQRMIITIALCVCVCPGKELLGAVYIFEIKMMRGEQRRTHSQKSQIPFRHCAFHIKQQSYKFKINKQKQKAESDIFLLIYFF